MSIPIAISPCPNDTYLFHAWIRGEVGQTLSPHVTFADIEQLNTWALAETYPLTKLSFSCFTSLVDRYQLLPIGSALGVHSGPKLIAKTSFPLGDLPTKRVAIPGRETTAHLLLSRLLPPPKEKRFCLYSDVPTLVAKEEVDCGLIIHETRFTFQELGFHELADLGELWEEETATPLLPLGGLAISRHLPEHLKREIVEILERSLAYARSHPKWSLPFILHHAQEQTPEIVQKHISTYVTEETASLSPAGIEAIEHLLPCTLPTDWLYRLPVNL
jgi:1,4-dihydroxy-6-naphthoate synthase